MKNTPDPPISIVDDDKSVRQALKSLIDSVGFKAEVFGSGEEFLNFGLRFANRLLDC